MTSAGLQEGLCHPNQKNFKKLKMREDSQTRKRIVRIQIDRGGEFTSQAFKFFLEENGIIHEAPPSTP